ncbi:isochorismatase family protein [Vreelandella venusta]
MRIKLPINCLQCGTRTRTRSSRKMTEGYHVLYQECTNKKCGFKFKAEEVLGDTTIDAVAENFDLTSLNPDACALMIIDQQQADMYYPYFRKRNNERAEYNMHRLLSAWRENSLPIIHVRHLSGDPESPYSPGHPGVRFKLGLEPLANEEIFDKSITDAFLRSNIEDWLLKRSIRQLVVVGSTSEGAVEATVRSASNLGFTVWGPDDACYTFEKFSYDAVDILPETIHTLAMTNLHQGNSTVVDTTLVLHAIEHAIATKEG